MSELLYVHAYFDVESRIIRRELMKFYFRIVDGKTSGKIYGLENIFPVISQENLDNRILNFFDKRDLLLPTTFLDALKQYPFRGLGIWSEWQSSEAIDKFHASEMHAEFSKYASTTLDSAFYRVIQYRGKQVKILEIGESTILKEIISK